MNGAIREKNRRALRQHTDWVNSLILTHKGQVVITASSDRSIRLWRPENGQSHCIGYHSDYAKALAYAPFPGWVASGGLDREVRVWDVQELRPQPLRIFRGEREECSIYSLATDPSGRCILSGSPEKVTDPLWNG